MNVNVGQLSNEQILRIATASVQIAADQRLPAPVRRWWSDLAGALLGQVVHRAVCWAEFVCSVDAHDVNAAAGAWLADRESGP